MSTEAIDERCPTCGGVRIGWQLRRSGAWSYPGAGRVVEWVCRGCGARWEVTSAPGGEPSAVAAALRSVPEQHDAPPR